MDLEVLEADQVWLTRQPGMGQWAAAHKRLGASLERLLREYSSRVCERVVRAGDAGRDRYLNRLWRCWSHHWRAAHDAGGGRGVDGWQVVERLRDGLAVTGSGTLGGDPLRDVVLAEAVLQRDNAATRLLEREYRPFALSLARRVRAPFPDEHPDWWSELADRLAGYTGSAAKLAHYSGRCGMRPWLAVVVRRFVYDHGRAKKSAPWELLDNDSAAERAGEAAPETGLLTRECLRVFLELIRAALTTLEAADRMLLRLSFVDGLSGRDAAQFLRVDPGTVSRRRARALKQLSDALDASAEAPDHPAPTRDCLAHLLGDRQRVTFGGALLDALQEFAPAGDRP